MTDKKIFYGWYIIPISALGLCFGYPGAFIFGFSSFILPLTEEFGWSRSAISLGITVSNIAMIGVMPMLGYLIDRKGTKNILFPATILFGLIMCSFFFLSGIWQFYALILALTILGGGASTISYVPLLASWFDKRKGLAIGLGVSGAGVGAMVVPPLVNLVQEQAGWREAYLTLGAINLLIVAPLVFFIVRNKPADIGSYPDGVSPSEEAREAASIINRTGYLFNETLRTRHFWQLALATLLLGMALTGSVSQLVPTLVDRGLTRSEAANAMSLLGVAIIAARILSGYMMDKFHAPYVASGFLTITCLGFLSLALLPSNVTALFIIIAIGIGLGVEFDVLGYFCAQYFGRVSMGKNYGVMYVIFNIGGATGVYLAGLSYDITASYYSALIGGAMLTFIAIAITVLLGSYPTLPVRQEKPGQ